MASPIFLSNPSSSFSIIAILKGAQCAFLGPYRLLQDQRFFENAKHFRFTLFAMLFSVLLQALLNIPTFIAELVKASPETISGISFLLINVLNIPAFTVLVLHCLYNEVFDELFLGGLRYIKDVSGRDYYCSLSKSPKIKSDIIWSQRQARVFDKLFSRSQLSPYQRTHMDGLLSTYIQITTVNVWLWICSQAPSYGSLLVSLQVARFFNPHIGSSLAILLFIVGLSVHAVTLISIISFYKMSVLSVWCVLEMSYFQRLRMSDVQIANWMDSRVGMIFGLGATSHLILQSFGYISVLVLILEQLSVSFLITKVTDPVPDSNILDPWILSQTIWTKEYKFTDIFDIDADGFRPLPGSYLLSSTSAAGSPLTSGYTTPRTGVSARSSTINLQDLTINTVH